MKTSTAPSPRQTVIAYIGKKATVYIHLVKPRINRFNSSVGHLLFSLRVAPIVVFTNQCTKFVSEAIPVYRVSSELQRERISRQIEIRAFSGSNIYFSTNPNLNSSNLIT